mgnify:FL=1
MSITHLLIDTETLGKKETAVVLSIGVVAFTFEIACPYITYVESGFYCKFDAAEQIMRYKRTVGDGVPEWWKTQPPEARAVTRPSPQDVSMVQGLTDLATWVKDRTQYQFKKSYVWARGPAFDFPKVEDMYDQSGVTCPYNNWRQRDVRTYIDIMAGVDTGVYRPRRSMEGNISHHALHDAAKDALAMQELYALAAGGEEEIPF